MFNSQVIQKEIEMNKEIAIAKVKIEVVEKEKQIAIIEQEKFTKLMVVGLGLSVVMGTFGLSSIIKGLLA